MANGAAELAGGRLGGNLPAGNIFAQRGQLFQRPDRTSDALAKAAGSTSIGDEISEAMLYPVAHRLIGKCDAIYRIAGASKGADMDIEVARKLGLNVYTSLESIPQA